DRIRISLETDDAVVYVIGEADLFKQLLLNLAINACDAFEGDEGEITFKMATDCARGKVELYIQDDGPGIAAPLLEQIFQPFFSTKKEGTGLGLSIVHRICAIAGLDLDVNSQVGYGTTFMIEFNLFSPQSASRAESEKPASVSN
ncbi:MAG: ATP-binding protein, partial [candidate division Zixibacteria bacterium]